jgi:hypothetical protein
MVDEALDRGLEDEVARRGALLRLPSDRGLALGLRLAALGLPGFQVDNGSWAHFPAAAVGCKNKKIKSD